MRRQYQVSPNGRTLICAAVASTIALTISGCAAPSLSTRSFPALSWSGDDNRIATGSIEREKVAAPPVEERPAIIRRVPRRVQTNRDQSSHLTAPRRVQSPKLHRPAPLAQPREPVAPHDELATFDPLPMYAVPDKKRNKYRWNGSHDRLSVDNRTPEAKLASKSQTFVDASGRRTVLVAPGDTMFGIAQRNGISTRDLMAMNNLSRSELRAGQVLDLPSNAH